MKRFKILPAILFLPLLATTSLASAQPAASTPAPSKTERSCHLPGVVEALRCVSVDVPLDYAKPQGAPLKLHVTVAPAYRQGTRSDPLFVLAGGPGQAGSDVLPLLKLAFDRVRATRDIVFIDQRGTGRSGKLDCESKPEHERMTDDELMAELRACIANNKQPLAAYTTANAARDLEQVRRALGYRQVNLWGGSYGTRLGQAYARAYPDSVRSLVLDGVAAPDQVIPAGGRDGQAALDGLFDACTKDAACNKAYPKLRAEFDALVQKVEAGDVHLSLPNPRTAEPTEFTMSSQRFLGTVHNILYAPADARRLPFLIHSASRGRWEPFVARQNLAGDFGNDASMSMLLHFAVVCAEDVPRFTPELMKSDAAVLARPLAEMIPKLCQDIRVPAVPYVAPSRIEAPTLLLSGALDPVTPPHRAATAAKSMAHAQHVVVANAGHGVSQLGCAPRLLRAFLDRPQDKLDAACMAEVPAPTFQLGSAGPQP
ncbi:alpha/beta fold hydrolase [Massilia sp. CFBP9012]|uniref:alpha/beta fold hydrolase n=1 Tax=Massilia sp. CFBP9012 TaxID=3096531 RepID=UPI002A6ADF17|nr:alpha/beta fold hydrolase [Massilia sp. CFBP9012]MDY0977828.1 alpha/beta fold hydrolase [Massilia sp. CFBP9012]